jgi:transposase
MGMAQLVVAAVLVEGRSKSEVARTYGVSRRWVITVVQRYLTEGDAGLAPRSRRPKRSPNRTRLEVEDEIVAVRKELAKAGHEAAAAAIAFHLQRRHGTSPAVSTIWRILSARGFVTPQPHKRPKSSYIRFQAEQPNERWQADITHWPLADGTDIEILNLIDDHSRLCVASTARRLHCAIPRIRLLRASWVTSARPSRSSRGGRYIPKRPLYPLRRPYQPPTGLSGERPHASTLPSCAGLFSSTAPRGTQSSRPSSQA